MALAFRTCSINFVPEIMKNGTDKFKNVQKADFIRFTLSYEHQSNLQEMWDEGKTLSYFAFTMGGIRNSNLPKYVFFASRLGTAVLSLSLQNACSGLMRRL